MLDVLSDSTDDVPVTADEVTHTSDVNSNGENKQETNDGQVCTNAEDLKQGVLGKGVYV